MPLSEKVRIEIFFPDLPDAVYPRLQNELEGEFSRTFGGCSVNLGLKGLYHSKGGKILQDRINLLFTDIKPLRFVEDRELLEEYVDYLHDSIISKLSEEKVLIAVYPVYHQTPSHP